MTDEKQPTAETPEEQPNAETSRVSQAEATPTETPPAEETAFDAKAKYEELSAAVVDLSKKVSTIMEVLDKLSEEESKEEATAELGEQKPEEKPPEAKPEEKEKAQHEKQIKELVDKVETLEKQLAQHGIRKTIPSAVIPRDEIADDAERNLNNFLRG